MALLVCMPVSISGMLCVDAAGNNHNPASFFHPADKLATAIPLVGQNQLAVQGKRFQQRLSHTDVITVSAGEQKRNDICMAQALLEPFDLNGKLILADKGYDSDKFVRWLEERGGIAVIPSRIIAKHPRKTDWHTYKERHLVENLFLKLKNNRRFATRYEKKALYFRAVVCLACILVWLL